MNLYRNEEGRKKSCSERNIYMRYSRAAVLSQVGGPYSLDHFAALSHSQAAPAVSVPDLHSSEKEIFKITNWITFKLSLGQKSHNTSAICNIITIFQKWISCPCFQSAGLNIWPSVQHTHCSECSQGVSLAGLCFLSEPKNVKKTLT